MTQDPSMSRRAPLSASDIESKMRESLAAAGDGLKQLLRSVEQSGMPRAAKEYRDFQIVLIQQRLWAQSHGYASLTPLFQDIARAARELYSVFHGYADVMRILKEIDHLEPSAEPASESAPDAPPASTESTSEMGIGTP